MFSIIDFREKCCKQKMKNTFRENVFVCEHFSVNSKKKELHRKDKVLGGSTENAKAPLF